MFICLVLGFTSYSRIGFRSKEGALVAGFLSAVVGFVSGLLAVQVPVLSCNMLQLILGLWTFYALGNFVFGILHDQN